jgi:hypothetical protein
VGPFGVASRSVYGEISRLFSFQEPFGHQRDRQIYCESRWPYPTPKRKI